MGRAGYAKEGSEMCPGCHRGVLVRWVKETRHQLQPRPIKGLDPWGREREIHPYHLCPGRPCRSHEEAHQQLQVAASEAGLTRAQRDVLERRIVETCGAARWEDVPLGMLAERLGALRLHQDHYGEGSLARLADRVMGDEGDDLAQ